MRTSLATVALVALVALATAACPPLTVGPRCATDGQCAGTDRCIDGDCLSPAEIAAREAEGEGEGEPIDDGPCEPTEVLLQYESDFLDLESGAVIAGDSFAEPTTWDVKIAFNANRDPPGVIFQNQAEGALITTAGGALCDHIDVEALAFTPNLVDVPFRLTMVVRTGTGNDFALGDPVNESEQNAQRFAFRPLD